MIVQPANGAPLPPGEGLRRSIGGWADDAKGLEEFLKWNRQRRKQSRGNLGECMDWMTP